MSRTKIRQVIQIANSEIYDDAYASAHTAGVAEPAHPDFNIEYDLNIMRTQFRNLKGATNWYDQITAGQSMADMAGDIDDLEAALGSSTGLAGMDYTTDYIVTDSTSAREAIGDLDGYLNTLTNAVVNFTGMDAYGDTTPGYASAEIVTQGVPLETAIGELDAYISSGAFPDTLQEVYDNQGGVEVTGSDALDFNITGIIQLETTAQAKITGSSSLITSSSTDVTLESNRHIVGFTSLGGFRFDVAADSYLKTTTGNLELEAGSSDGYLVFDQQFTSHPVRLSTEDTTWESAIETEDGRTGGDIGIIDAINAATRIADGQTLQSVYDESLGADPDILVGDGDELDFELGTGSVFKVSDSAGSPTFEVTENHVKIYDATDNDPTFEVTDGYVKIDGYLTVTGSSFIVDSTINDADHWVLHPGLSTQTALRLEPKTAAGVYTADLMDAYDGYGQIDGVRVMRMDDTGAMFLATDVDSVTPQLITSAAGGDMFLGGRLEVDGYSRFDSLMDANAGLELSTSFQYDVSPTDGHFLKTDASGNASWEQITDTDVDLNATLNISGTGTTVETALEAHDAYMIQSRNEIDNMQSELGLDTSGNYDVAGLVAVTGNDMSQDILALDGYTVANAAAIGSLQNIDLIAGDGMTGGGDLTADRTFNVVGTAGEITALADSIKIADAFNKVDFTSITATSSGAIDLESTGGAVTIDAAGASNFSTSSGDMTIASAAGELNLDGATVDINSTGALTVDSTTATHTATTFDVEASGAMTLDSDALTTLSGAGIDITSDSSGDIDLSGDGYISFDDQFLADAYYLSTGASGWNTNIEAVDGRSGNNIGIMDAINAAALSGSGKIEKGIFVLASSDARLSGTGALSSNVLDMDAGSGADRGSVDLDSVGLDHDMERDVEVYVNGILQLADASQGVASGSATDDFYVASDDVTKLVFSFDLQEGDIVTVINRKADPAEDVDAGW